MAAAYSLARDGDAYRFTINRIKSMNTKHILPVIVLGSSLLILPAGIYLSVEFNRGKPSFAIAALCFAVWGAAMLWSMRRAEKAKMGGPTYGNPAMSFVAGANGIRLKDGRLIPANRINNVEVRNEVGGGPSGGVYIATGLQASAAALGNFVSETRALRKFYICVQYAGMQEVIARNLDEMGAMGITHDIMRALRGEALA